MKEAGLILMQSVPPHIEVSQLEKKLSEKVHFINASVHIASAADRKLAISGMLLAYLCRGSRCVVHF